MVASRIARPQRAHHAGAVEIARRLASGDEDARSGARDHQDAGAASGGVRTASATRSASASAARPSSPRDHDLALAPHRVHEALQLQRQRVGFRRLQHDPLHHVGQLPPGARLPAVSQPHELAAAGGQIEREVAVGLEQTEPADPLARHPRGGRQRHRAVGELDPRVGDVQMGGEHRQSRGANLGGSTLPVRCSTRSRSWIIRSSTTATSVPRGWNGASRWLSM